MTKDTLIYILSSTVPAETCQKGRKNYYIQILHPYHLKAQKPLCTETEQVGTATGEVSSHLWAPDGLRSATHAGNKTTVLRKKQSDP